MKQITEPCKRISKKLGKSLRGLVKDQSGMSAVMFAAAIVPAFSAIGTGVDITRVMIARSKLTAAVDAAALAGGRVYYSSTRQNDIESYFKANLPVNSFNATVKGPYAESDDSKGTLRVWAEAKVPTGFMRIVGVEDITVSSESIVTRQTSMLDVVLAIDLSGSMLSSVPGEARSRVDAAKAAAEELVNIIYGDPPSSLVRVGIVPWGGKVNVTDFGTQHGIDAFGHTMPEPVGNGNMGSRYRAVNLGQTYDNPFQAEHYTYSYRIDGTNEPGLGVEDDPFVSGSTIAKERFLLPDGHEDKISKVYYAHNSAVPLLAPPPKDWKGCVYARYASTARPFAWDENAGWYDRSQDKNNAADMEDGVVTNWGPDKVDWVGWMPMGEEGEPQPGGNKCDLARLNNHSSECTPCLESGVHRLDGSKSKAVSVLRGLQAEGSVYTNIPQGLMWAYRLISDAAPFTEGAENADLFAGYERERAIVLLTDGANTVRPGDAYNRAMRRRSDRDKRLRDIATKIKDEKGLIYTVQFANGDSDLSALMKDVASKPDAPFYYYAPSSEQLSASFRAVANNLANLRISK